MSSPDARLAGFFSEPFQNTRIVETPLTEHSTAQSVWPGLANSPLMTLFGFFADAASCGIVHPLLCSSWTRLAGSSGNAVGGSRTMYVSSDCEKDINTNASTDAVNRLSFIFRNSTPAPYRPSRSARSRDHVTGNRSVNERDEWD